MKTLLSIVASLLMIPTMALAAPIFSATPTQSGGTLIDFEGQADGTDATNLYAGLGVSFGTAAGFPRIWNPALGGNQVASSGTGVLGPSAADNDPLSIIFDVGQSFVEFFFADPNVFAGTTYMLTAYDGGGVVLESLFLSADNFPGNFYLGFARGLADIRRISIDPSNGGENFSVDDLRFGVAVPEPSTIAVLGLGLGLLAGARRRFN